MSTRVGVAQRRGKPSCGFQVVWSDLVHGILMLLIIFIVYYPHMWVFHCFKLNSPLPMRACVHPHAHTHTQPSNLPWAASPSLLLKAGFVVSG